MIAKTRILRTLNSLDNLYRTGRYPFHLLFYSKLAVLEFSGWIEEAMDDLVIRHARKRLKNPRDVKYVQNQIIKRNHSFSYEKHFREMLTKLVGIVGFSQLERQANQRLLPKLIAELNYLKTERDKHAHKHIPNTTLQIDSPSVTRGRFTNVYNGIREFERLLRSL